MRDCQKLYLLKYLSSYVLIKIVPDVSKYVNAPYSSKRTITKNTNEQYNGNIELLSI